jgi:glutamyl-tRNA reductase
MKLALAGVNHKTAPVQLREKLAFRSEDIPAALLDMQSRGAREALIVSTCNRVEITAALDDDVPFEALFAGMLAGRLQLSFEEVRPHLYLFEEREAIRHLFRVASSLDSMIVGEPQILGQLKQAFAQARDQGAIGNTLEAILSRAFNVAKRVRTETEIGSSAVSVSYVAVELAREIFGSLQTKSILIVGAGKMSEGAARHLMRAGVSEIFITNRTPERAQQMARVFQGKVVDYDHFPDHLADMDIVITSSAAPGYVVTPEMVRRALTLRKSRPMLLIDIAVPRNVDPATQKLEHAFAYNIDDLQELANRNMSARRDVALQAEAIVTEEVTRLEARLRERGVAPTIVSLQEQLEVIRQEVVSRYRGRLGLLTREQEDVIEAMTRGIINKVAHGPISEMRRQAAAGCAHDLHPREAELVSTVRRIFNLGER